VIFLLQALSNFGKANFFFGYSLVRKVFTDYNEKISLKEYGENVTMGDVLLTPTKIYVKPILKVLEKFNVNGMAHITGGGLYENLPRCMGKDLSPVVFREKVRVPEIFKLIAERSKIKEEELYKKKVFYSIIVDT